MVSAYIRRHADGRWIIYGRSDFVDGRTKQGGWVLPANAPMLGPQSVAGHCLAVVVRLSIINLSLGDELIAQLPAVELY